MKRMFTEKQIDEMISEALANKKPSFIQILEEQITFEADSSYFPIPEELEFREGALYFINIIDASTEQNIISFYYNSINDNPKMFIYQNTNDQVSFGSIEEQGFSFNDNEWGEEESYFLNVYELQ